MSQEANDRSLVLGIAGPSVQNSRIQLEQLVTKLDAFQKSLFNVAAAIEGSAGNRGRWSNAVRASCELTYVATQPGSIQVVVELPAESPDLFPPSSGLNGDLGMKAAQTLIESVRAVQNADHVGLRRLMPDSGTRFRALRSIDLLCPGEDEAAKVTISGVGLTTVAELTADSRRRIAETLTNDDDLSMSNTYTVTGPLVEIRVIAGRRHITVLMQQREVACIYPSDLEPIVSQLVPGSVVEVTGRGQLTYDGHVRQIDEVYDVSMVDLSSFLIGQFRWHANTWKLRRPVVCLLEFRNDLWVYEVPSIYLHKCA